MDRFFRLTERGTTTSTEFTAGIHAGGRTGLTALTMAVLFLLTLFLTPLATSIPAFATAPALVFVACLMAKGLLTPASVLLSPPRAMTALQDEDRISLFPDEAALPPAATPDQAAPSAPGPPCGDHSRATRADAGTSQAGSAR